MSGTIAAAIIVKYNEALRLVFKISERFMLQEKISLAREIDYLNNYISLQKLRTDSNPIVKIEAEIEQQVNTIQIAPMLLIPFVENAFKHGISSREPSHIKISLEI